MRSIRGVALGTYYAKGAAGAQGCANVSAMRGLVYLVKDNREPGKVGPQTIGHPRLASRASERISIDTALGYCAAIVAEHFVKIREVLQLGAAPVSIVPIPSSKVTAANAATTKWRTRDLAHELERLGVGTAAPVLVNREAHASKSEGARHSTSELVTMMHLQAPVPSGYAVLILDDVIDDGNHIAAADILLGRPERAGICVVALTDADGVPDARQPRGYTLSYDETSSNIVPEVDRKREPSAS